MRGDERAVSIPLTHALTFGITAILVTLLLSSAGAFLQSQEQVVGESQLNEIGSDIASHTESLDRLNQRGDSGDAKVSPAYPSAVVGDSYTISFGTDDDGGGVVEIETSLRGHTLDYPVSNETALDTDAEMESTEPVLCVRDDEITLGEVNCDE